MLSTLNLKRAKPNDLIESSDQSAIAIAPGAEESCPAPDTRPSRDLSLRMEPRFTAPAASTPVFTGSDFTAERMVPQAETRQPISRTDTEHLTPHAETEQLVAPSDALFPSSAFPSPANDIGPAEDQPSIRLDREPSAFGKAVKRAITGLVIMIAGAGATVGWKAFGDDAKQLVEGLTHQVPLVSWLHLKHQDAAQTSGAAAASATPAETADASAQPSQDAAQAADTPPADSSQQAATPADQQTAPQQPAPQQAAAPTPAPAAPASTDTAATSTAAAPSPDVTQLTQSVQALTREVAVLQKAMAEMKTNNEQMARDIAKLNTPRRAAVAPRPATPPPTAQVQRPASLPPVQSTTTPRPVSQYQPPTRPYPVSQEAAATQPHAVPPPPSSNGPTVVYSQQPTSPPPSYTQPRTYYSDPSGYADSSPAPRPPAAVGGY